MRVTRLLIRNYRGVKEGVIHFNDHALIVGNNNVGKSTICEALDLVLGPDRLSRNPVIDEHDFYNGTYLPIKDEPVQITIEVTLTKLTDEAKRRFKRHLEFWDWKRLQIVENIDEGMAEKEGNELALRVIFVGKYDSENDEFIGQTFFKHPEVEQAQFGRDAKRLCGYLYLRALRTGSRALSLEKGSLLDIAMRLKNNDQASLWETTLNTLREFDPQIHKIEAFESILSDVEKQVKNFINLSEGESLALYPNQLTREHLRKTVAFFSATAPSSKLIPFQRLGTGTINAFVFALLTLIAKLKTNVIFAMEEPEIALPPHTQRRLVNYVLDNMSQVIITSHSPFVLEQVSPDNLLIIRRSLSGELTGTKVELHGLKEKNFRREFRRQFAEAILGKSVLVVEGETELSLLSAIAESHLSKSGITMRDSLDLLGLTIIEAQGDGSLEKIGNFFKGIGHKAFSFFDKQRNKSPEKIKAIHEAFDQAWEHDHSGIEKLLIKEIPVIAQRRFFNEALLSDWCPPEFVGKSTTINDQEIGEILYDALKHKKGDGLARRLIGQCNPSELPETITNLLIKIETQLELANPVQGTKEATQSLMAQ